MKSNICERPASLISAIESEKHPIRVKVLAEILGCSIHTVYRAVRKGTVPFLRINGTIRFDPTTLGNYFRRKYPAMAENMHG